MKEFRQFLEDYGYDTVFVNAFFEGSTDKQLFDAIMTDFVEEKPPGSVEECVERLIDFYSEENAPQLFILINNVESPGIARSLHLLQKLVKSSKIHLIATIDKVYGPFVFDQSQFGNFKFLSFEITSFTPFFIETKVSQNLLSKSSGKIGKFILFNIEYIFTGVPKRQFNLCYYRRVRQIIITSVT